MLEKKPKRYRHPVDDNQHFVIITDLMTANEMSQMVLVINGIFVLFWHITCFVVPPFFE